VCSVLLLIISLEKIYKLGHLVQNNYNINKQWSWQGDTNNENTGKLVGVKRKKLQRTAPLFLQKVQSFHLPWHGVDFIFGLFPVVKQRSLWSSIKKEDLKTPYKYGKSYARHHKEKKNITEKILWLNWVFSLFYWSLKTKWLC